jgi:hypothetical protein
VGLKDLHVQSRFWGLWSEDALRSGRWQAFSLNAPASRSLPPLRSVLRFFASEEDEFEQKQQQEEASAFVSAMRNYRENERRAAVTATVPTNKEQVWTVKRPEKSTGVSSIFNRLLGKDSYFVPIFGHALETTARKLVYRLMWGKDLQPPLFPVTGVFPVKQKRNGCVCFFVFSLVHEVEFQGPRWDGRWSEF